MFKLDLYKLILIEGEKSLRRILEYMERIADRALPDDAFQIRRACSDISSMTNSLCELRQNKQVPSIFGLQMCKLVYTYVNLDF